MKKKREINQDLEETLEVLPDNIKVKVKKKEGRINKKLKKQLDEYYS